MTGREIKRTMDAAVRVVCVVSADVVVHHDKHNGDKDGDDCNDNCNDDCSGDNDDGNNGHDYVHYKTNVVDEEEMADEAVLPLGEEGAEDGAAAGRIQLIPISSIRKLLFFFSCCSHVSDLSNPTYKITVPIRGNAPGSRTGYRSTE